MLNDGYTTALEYTDNFYSDWSLSNLALQCVLKGIHFPKITNACELGFGQGINLNIMAATSDVNWYGTDFLQTHADNAQTLSDSCGNEAHIVNLAFDKFAKVEDLPQFDLIVLHGIFSWVSKDNQAVIVNFIDKYLSKTGIVYISYNTSPGSLAFQPAQYLMNQIRKYISQSHPDPLEQIKFVSRFMTQFHQTNPYYLEAFPGIEKRIQGFQEKDPKYLVHEYFNADWQSFFFSEIADKLAPMGLKYLGQSRLNSELPILNFSDEQLNFLKSANITGALEQDLKDALCNRQFRRDIWLKSPQPLKQEDLEQWFGQTHVRLTSLYSKVDLTIAGTIKTASLDNPLYQSLLEKLKDYQAYTLEMLINQLSISAAQLLEMIGLLHSKGIIALQLEAELASSQLEKTRRLNSHMINNALQNHSGCRIALPLVGVTIKLDYWGSLYVYLYQTDAKMQQNPVESIEKYLSENQIQVHKNGITLNDSSERQSFLEQIVQNIHDSTVIAFLQAHKVI